ncbi:MAG: hypothetical protein IKV94_02725 [Clostridia bacterium]|nr:hypothetical protein [Clostridia bacterium]MBR6517144.1 hypothetical protein [Bacilli bacterium]
MNGGIQPTVELATNNGNGGFYPYPVYPMMAGNNGGGNGGFGWGSEAIWLIVLLALIWGNNGNGNGGFFGNGNSFDNGYAWLSNGQKDIMNQTSDGFNSLHLSNQMEGVRDGIYSLSNQLCNCCSDMQQTVSGGFANAESSANARQIANMQQAFATQTAITSGINGLSTQFADCCCENRLANCQTQNIIQNEANATRFADANNTRDLLTNQTANTQAILDKLCQLELDGKNDRIAELERELQRADLRASQTAQNAFISQGFANEVDALYNRLNNCPVPTTPVYGRTPIFTCPNNNGCGCNGNNAYLF